jgi:hypothetical protein
MYGQQNINSYGGGGVELWGHLASIQSIWGTAFNRIKRVAFKPTNR